MTASTHDDAVHRQFSPQATAYLNSAVHAQGEDLRQMAAIAAAQPAPACRPGLRRRPCELSCRAWPPRSRPTTCRSRCWTWWRRKPRDAAWTICPPVAARPSACPADGEFDLVMSRYSTHHWRDPGLGLREAFRVSPGGTAVFADVVSPGEALLDTWLQMIEALRDTSRARLLGGGMDAPAGGSRIHGRDASPAVAGISILGDAHAPPTRWSRRCATCWRWRRTWCARISRSRPTARSPATRPPSW